MVMRSMSAPEATAGGVFFGTVFFGIGVLVERLASPSLISITVDCKLDELGHTRF